VVNQFRFIAEEVREIMAQLGIRKFDDLIGRVDLLETDAAVDHWKAAGVDLSNIFYKPDVAENVAIRHVVQQDHSNIADVLDHELIRQCRPALDNQSKVRLDFPIGNTDRTTGAMLSYHVSVKYGEEGLPDDTIRVHFKGSAGQSFGAFLAPGITFHLEGDANDYLGKGLSGGTIIVHPAAESTIVPEENIIAGNVVLYGAISGRAYLRGIAGERFCIRNSGCHAVVEGVGEHGCEYMTGGVVVILGDAGRNFAAGMSGGIAYVLDRNRNFNIHCNTGMVDLVRVEEKEDIDTLRRLIEEHQRFTQSTVAAGVLKEWETFLPQFVKVYPRDYKRVLEERRRREKETLMAEVL